MSVPGAIQIPVRGSLSRDITGWGCYNTSHHHQLDLTLQSGRWCPLVNSPAYQMPWAP